MKEKVILLSSTTVKQYNSFNPIVRRIQNWLFRFASKYKNVKFCWVPAHVGIHGNEMADLEAKAAIFNRSIGYRKVPHTDMKPVIRAFIRSKWQEEWSSPSLKNNRKYRDIRPSIDIWSSSCHVNRGFETRLTRLRIGHTRLTHSHILMRDDPPVCDSCQSFLTVKHILVDCSEYSRVRRKYHLHGKSINEILDDDLDVDNLMKFLKEVNLFDQI